MLSGDESFEHFDLSLYPAEYDFNLGTTPREFMRKQMESCRNYATSFPGRLPSLLMQGGTGLGKTYLSACIARVVSEKGCSVCYDTAVSAFEAYEKLRFSKDPEETDQYNAKIRRMLDCDLMILDDLGTELVTSVTVSALYNLINTRLLCGKPTIISTNCTDEELNRKYSPQICSRLLGEFRKVPFCGNDIRLLRKGH
jgi:DNA replication protein DnaC